jgi:[calcium/calmodulin-dependent protein kinase] kinase
MKILNKKTLEWKFVSKNTTAYQNIMDEINILKKLDHENVVKLVEVIDQLDDDTIYIVMEYLESKSLSKELQIGPLKPARIWNYFRNIVIGLEYCHEVVGVIHRDIKPENLLISKNDKIKISDFGCSHLMENGTEGLVKTVGSNFYFAPEV